MGVKSLALTATKREFSRRNVELCGPLCQFVLLDQKTADIYTELVFSLTDWWAYLMSMRALKSLLVVTLLTPATGCLFTHASERVIRQDEQLYEVGYQSALAEETFQACVSHPDAKDSGKSGSFVGIPFLLAWARSERLSENAVHNDQIILCDTNGDGIITDLEALRYRDRYFPNVEPGLSLASKDAAAEANSTKPVSAAYVADSQDDAAPERK